jgi:hypothetical protein
LPELQRTRGSFGAEASEKAVAVPAGLARVIPVVLGAFALFGLGLLACRAGIGEPGHSRRSSEGSLSPRCSSSEQ